MFFQPGGTLPLKKARKTWAAGMAASQAAADVSVLSAGTTASQLSTDSEALGRILLAYLYCKL